MIRTALTSIFQSLAVALTVAAAGPALAQFSDNFGTAFDYTGGAVQGIWDGSYNMTNLVAAGGSVQAIPAPPAGPPGLVFDFDDTLGWEGNRSNSPFLFKNVNGSQDFVAEVTIAAQTSGQWSDAGIIVRAKQGTPPGVDADHADENFTFFGSFRTNPANADTGTTLHKRIEAGAQVQDSNVGIITGNEPLPIRLRLEKNGGAYIGWVSPDNGTTWQIQSTATATAGTGLADPNVVKEVGLSFAPFTGNPPLMGSATFQNFTLTIPQRPDLIVNTVTGATVIRNDLDVPVTFDYYEISSVAGRLNPTGWNSLSDQNIDPIVGGAADFNGVDGVTGADLTILRNNFGTGTTKAQGDADGDADVDGGDFLVWQSEVGSSGGEPGEGDTWDEAGGVSSNLLAELFLNGSTTLAPGEQLSLGNAFAPGAAGDLELRLGLAGQNLLTSGDVKYVTTGPAAAVPEPGSLTAAIALAVAGAMIRRSRQ